LLPQFENAVTLMTVGSSPAETSPISNRSPWWWVPSLYFAEAVPYVLVMTVAVALYKRLGISNDDIAFYTSLLYLPWVVKPLWSPLVDVLGQKRRWILAMQLVILVTILGVGATIPSANYFTLTLCFFWVMAIGSATHDIAADGFYMIGMPPHEQAMFVGIRSSFYRLGIIAGQGLLVMFAGVLETRVSTPTAWSWSFVAAAATFLLLAIYHQFALPRRESRKVIDRGKSILNQIVHSVTSFVRKPGITVAIAYILLYRCAEAQLVKLAQPFLLDERADGGLALTTTELGVVYGTIGVAMLVLGGIVGGLVAARHGLKRWIIWMALAINVPNLAYVYLAYAQPEDLWIVGACVAVEQLGYGFGFAGYMLYLLYISRGEHETAHYAICTGLMALGMMIPGLYAGKFQEWLGYDRFFVWVVISTIPSFLVTFLISIDPDFGRKQTS
jgi:PAT family beta-lactamase induction signal transducer AmpG